MKDENIKLLIKNEYENGAGVTELSKKYKISANTINSWKKREKWRKKVAPKGNAPNSKKCTKNKIGANDKETQIKSDIINNVPKEEIMEKYGIKKTKYYSEAKSLRQLRIERTEKYLEEVIDEVYKNDIEKLLKNGEKVKANLLINTLNLTKENEIDYEKIAKNEKAYNAIKKMLNDVMRTNKMITPFEIAEIESHLVDESIQLERLEIEKSKNNMTETDNKIEIELVGI